jgi:hypothetical protein
MKINMRIETRDKTLSSHLLETDHIQSFQTEKIIGDGVSIRYEGQIIREAIGFPELFNFSIYIAEHIALPIAVGILSRYLYDKLKDKKETKIEVNYVYVEINPEKIENAILNIVQKNEDKHQDEM